MLGKPGGDILTIASYIIIPGLQANDHNVFPFTEERFEIFTSSAARDKISIYN
jgi:hypothetical protein